nr:hypothetical protein [Enterobacter kobei]
MPNPDEQTQAEIWMRAHPGQGESESESEAVLSGSELNTSCLIIQFNIIYIMRTKIIAGKSWAWYVSDYPHIKFQLSHQPPPSKGKVLNINHPDSRMVRH